jgi:DNA (cytosine-5)-methyltransferase 1
MNELHVSNGGLRELHLFAGAGGGVLGGMLLGHTCVCAVEIEPYCRKVLLQRQRDGILPKFPIWDDVRTFDGKPWQGKVDCVCGGFPCQPFSSASRGRITAINLWPEMSRIIGEVKPRFVFAENVERKPIEFAAEDLRTMGYTPRAIPITASDLGADHIRPRYWLFAHANHEGELQRKFNAEMAIMQELPCCIWKSFTDYTRMDDGVANRMDRFKSIGNGQVPSVVRLAWNTLKP